MLEINRSKQEFNRHIDMNKKATVKKTWVSPSVQVLNIKKDTFSGSGVGAEKAGKAGPPKKR